MASALRPATCTFEHRRCRRSSLERHPVPQGHIPEWRRATCPGARWPEDQLRHSTHCALPESVGGYAGFCGHELDDIVWIPHGHDDYRDIRVKESPYECALFIIDVGIVGADYNEVGRACKVDRISYLPGFGRLGEGEIPRPWANCLNAAASGESMSWPSSTWVSPRMSGEMTARSG